MKSKIKYLVGFALSLSLLVCPLSISFSDIKTVSAFSSSVTLPESPSYANNVDHTVYDSAFNALKTNSNFKAITSGYVFCTITNNQFYGVVLDPSAEITNVRFATYNDILLYGDYATISCTVSELPTYQFDFVSASALPTVRPSTNVFNSVLYSTVLPFRFYVTGAYLSNNNVSIGNSFNASAIYPFENAYTPTPNSSLPLSLNINVDGFYNWLVETQKDSNFVSYFNLRALSQYLQFYSAWGSAPQKFLVFYNIDFGDSYGDHLSNTQIISLKNLTDRLYREYLESLKYPPADFPARDRVTVRKDIDTTTTDNNTVLITDDSDDTVIVSILRDILRGVIAIRNQIYVTGTDIITGLDDLDFTVNVANNGGELPDIDLSSLYSYDSDAFDDDLQLFFDGIEDVQSVPSGYIDTIGQNALMPENMLEDKNSLTVNIPCITGFTIGNNGNTYSTQTGTYSLSSSDYPWLDPIVKKIKRFASIILILGYLVHLRYRIPELVRGE